MLHHSPLTTHHPPPTTVETTLSGRSTGSRRMEPMRENLEARRGLSETAGATSSNRRWGETPIFSPDQRFGAGGSNSAGLICFKRRERARMGSSVPDFPLEGRFVGFGNWELGGRTGEGKWCPFLLILSVWINWDRPRHTGSINRQLELGLGLCQE
ncbi:hypothetical protein BO70DRAFT_119924 [Aspergillus heteromorphus CBS 117.55]|uniref:Uncharacterized protein n=1 Tax=Aspergillus heteromorphus CBS 117.55 TaxID=1448321 RepID=A0A317VBA1_9EURO|nr:uncharacterized protein BO70DRAFT_119924 [Aspergillus heteromorphus CBS 117.55]PWY71633.1 hypothetical protein BO70DRAFT_119924 [Aspergillus heteromorphus CBS 117.55]